jgi:hypothetical protein
MALVGGGGAPNVGGGNPVGTGSSINYIGNHAYANSGPIAVAQADTTQLDFTTGSQYIVAKFRFNTESTDDDIRFQVNFDGQTVQGYTIGSSNNHAFHSALDLLIPPYTHVTTTGYNESSSSGRTTYASITGRVY